MILLADGALSNLAFLPDQFTYELLISLFVEGDGSVDLGLVVKHRH